VEVTALVRRAYRLVERLVIGVVVAVAVLVAVISLRLMSGPIDLDFLKPRIAQALDTAGGKLKIDAAHISLEWSGLSQPVNLVFKGIHVTDMEGKEVATAPSVALSFAPRIVFEGHLLPTAIVVEQPTLDGDIDRQGGMLRRVFGKTDSNSQGEVVELLIDQLLAEPNHHSLLGQLDTVIVERGRVTLRDIPSGVVWTAPAAHVSLKRDISGVIISADARFSRGPAGEPVDVSLSGTYARDRSRIEVEARIDGLKPLMFADFSPDVAILGGIDIALSGKLNIEASGDGEIHKVRMEVTGGRGTINLPGILPAQHTVRSVSALASVDTAAHIAKIEHVDIDLGAVQLSIAGTGQRTEKGQSFSGRADMRQVPTDRLGEYWPLGLAEGGRAWALANLSLGSVDVGAEFAFSAPGDDLSNIAVDRMVALLDYRGLKVHYMSHMPEVEGVSGKARFENNTMHFDVAGGTAVGLGVTGATVDLTNLDDPDAAKQFAMLHLPIAGPAAQVMAMISRPRLGLPRDALFDPKRIGGDAAVMLDLRFPLLNDLAVSDIDIRATTALSGLSLKGMLPDLDLTDGVGKIVYADDQLNASGQIKLDGNQVDLNIRQLFAPKSPFRQRYELKGTLPTSLMVKAGLPSPEPYISGPVGTTIVYQTQPNGTSDVTGKFDLKAAKFDGSLIGWTKAAGVDASLNIGVKLSAAAKLLSADFDGKGNGLAAKGQVGFADGGIVQRVRLSQFSLGRSDVALDWRRNAAGVDMALYGRSLELSRVRDALKARDEAAAKRPDGAAAKAEGDTKLSVKLDQVVLKRGTLGALNGQLEMTGERLASADLSLGAGKGAAFKVAPAAAGRSIAVFIPDFGLLLKEAGWLDGLVGGDLNFQGRFDDSAPESKLSGTLRMGPYRMTKVEPRSDIGSLNSMIDGLNRTGNALQQFDKLEARVVKVGDRVDIAKGRTSGKSIGLTTEGWLDLGNDTARLRGAVVPGFALNNLLSNVPLLGPLLTGGKDGGLFAFTYRLEGPLDDLKSDVNVMSAMTPGALRELFATPITPDPVQDSPRATP
jgi:hypothetical protein